MKLGMATGSELNGAWFMAAMEHSPIGIALVGLDGRWLWTNHALRDTLGYDREELERLSFQDITHPDDLNQDLNHFERLIAGDGIAYQMENAIFVKTGRLFGACCRCRSSAMCRARANASFPRSRTLIGARRSKLSMPR